MESGREREGGGERRGEKVEGVGGGEGWVEGVVSGKGSSWSAWVVERGARGARGSWSA